MSAFGPKTVEEEPIFAAEAARVDAQCMIQRRMNECGVDSAEVARRLGVDVSEIDAIWESENELSVRFLAKVLWALDNDRLLMSTRESGVRRIDLGKEYP